MASDSLFTSYSTSLALRDAGAPQDGDQFWWIDSITGTGIRCSHPFSNPKTHSRAFRSDEIIEALGDRFSSILQPSPGTWKVTVYTPTDFHRSRATSLVEALAAAWLAVLAGAK